MPIPIVMLSDNGLEPAPYRADSLREAALMEPPGVYTVTRTYPGGRAVLLDAHLDRLEESARLEGIPVTFERERIRSGLRRLLSESEHEQTRVRMTVTRSGRHNVILALEPWPGVEPSLKEEGVRAATARLDRENPKAKSNAWEHRRQEAMKALPEDVYEGLLVDDQERITEGFTSNIFAIKAGRLHTAAENVLLGISRHILLSARPPDVPLLETPIGRDELDSITECFLTSSSRGVIPIVKIDQQTIGNGRPGGTTRRLSRCYDEWVRAHLEPI